MIQDDKKAEDTPSEESVGVGGDAYLKGWNRPADALEVHMNSTISWADPARLSANWSTHGCP